MTFHNLFIPHERSAEQAQWLKAEIGEQQLRYNAIVKAMDEMSPQREISTVTCA